MTNQHEEPDTYPWMTAPAHLMTRRQLRAAGLRPNGQDPVAVMVRKRRGRQVIAQLYDSRNAAPKRTASPAQLGAVAKAIRAHQLAAAARRGLTEKDLTAAGDPGPAWTTNTSENTAKDTTMTTEAAAEVHMIANGEDIHGRPAQDQLGAPAGAGQQLAYFLAAMALADAGHRQVGIEEASEMIAGATDPELARGLAEERDALRAKAEARMTELPWNDQFALNDVFAEAIAWHAESEICTATMNKISADYARQWGVLVDVDTREVTVDPDFDAIARQDFDEAAALWERESVVLDFVSAMSLPSATKGAVVQAISAWQGEPITAENPRGHLVDAPDRRAALSQALGGAGLSSDDRARVDFVVDYLRGDTSAVDLLASPVYVDVGIEVRGRAEQLLESFATGRLDGKVIAREISVMSPADQDQMRSLGRDLHAGKATEESIRVWADHADRDRIAAQLGAYADDLQYFRDAAVEMATSNQLGADMRMGLDLAISRKEYLSEAYEAQGLAALERAQLARVIDDIEAGRITSSEQLPELLFVDERSKQAADEARTARPARELADSAQEMTTALLAGVDLSDSRRRDSGPITEATTRLTEIVYSVGIGAPGEGGVQALRTQFDTDYAKLGKALNRAGASPAVQNGIGTAINAAVKNAWSMGKAAAARTQGWTTKVDQLVTARDTVAQKDTGARPRQCQTRPSRASARSAAAAAAEPVRPQPRYTSARQGIGR
ncbi:RRQRL motif-containing zinc-binding protein [Nocardia neocaledoniensis]|uniref:RRQRL motif-containing zinc-binding protein n=2 Tax=Bacteria TaxID=2 RepID=UPI002453ACF7|nr:RRQRL motif-containing zinc-binding protein [Nocardia neocaledoniensis]